MAPATRNKNSSAFLFALCADLHWHAALYACAHAHPTTAFQRWTPVPGRGVLLASSTWPLPWPEDARGTIMLPQCNDRKLARASQDHCWIRLGSAAGCSRQKGAACQARRGDRRTKLPRDRERTLCHVMVITDSLWEPSPHAHYSRVTTARFRFSSVLAKPASPPCPRSDGSGFRYEKSRRQPPKGPRHVV